MEYRQLGKTDLRLSLLGFGASPLGNAFQAIDPAEATRAVHLAIDSGINFFDVSPYYGITLAERRLGEALEGRREKVVLATKCGRYGAAEFDFSARRVTASIDESLARLRTDYVDLLFVHDVEFGDFNQIVEETVPALRRLQALGKARYIGVTGYPVGMLAKIVESAPVDAVLSYCRYNMMITDMDEVLTPVVERRQVGLINASPLNMGLLTETGAPDWHPAPPEIKAAAAAAAALCKERGVDLSRIAINFCTGHPYVASTLVGMATTSHVKENLQALDYKIDTELERELQAIFRPVFNHAWPSGRPENQ